MNRDRDHIIEQALKHELRTTAGPVGDACLDHETLAAWMDGGLDAGAVAALEAHVSNCDRCRSLAATFVRTEPLAPGTTAPGTLSLWRWWLAPLAAGAAAVTLWMVVPQESANREPGLPAEASAKVGAGNRAPIDAIAGKDIAQAPATAAPQQPAASSPAASSEFRQNVPAAKPQEKLADADRGRLAVGNVAAGRDEPAKSEEAAGQRADAALMAEAGAKRPEPAREAADTTAAAAAPAAPSAPAAVQLRKQTAALEIVSTDPSRRWRAAAQGAIEHSEDSGRTWFPVSLGTGETLAAGSSPSPGVCWFVGRRGVVLLAIDGVSFVRLPFPEAVDLVSVTAADGRTATVTTADGRTLRTTDSGRTWR